MERAILIAAGAAFAALCCALGRYFGRGKGAKWVNTTGDPGKVNMPETLKFLSKFMYALAVTIGGSGILAGITGIAEIFIAGMLLTVAVCIAVLIYMNVSGRFKL